jgi:hypothetical protein
MKHNVSSYMRAIACSLALGAAAAAQAQTPDYTVNNFDADTEAASWIRWWGGANQIYEFDPSVDANASASSGSLKATVEFDRVAAGGDNQFALVGSFPENVTIDGSQYENLVFDLRWDPNSPKRSGGDFGFLEIGFRKSDFSQLWLDPLVVPATAADGWMRVTLPISASAAGVDQITGIVFKMWSGDPATGFIGNTVFWIDNVHLEGREDTTVPEPTMSIRKAEPGLSIIASSSGQYDRQNIQTVAPTQSFVGATSPVSYSFTIAEYPGIENAGFQTHLFLVPGAEGLTDGTPDWNQPNVIFLDLQNNGAGGGSATFRYKTNSPGGNTMIYNGNPDNGSVGTLASLGSDTMIGTWTLTFTNDTSVTITTPSGTSTNFAFPAESAALFADPMYVYLGVQPNQLANRGQGVRFTNFRTTGTANPIDENFAGVVPEENPEAAPDLDATVWRRAASDAAGIFVTPTDATYIVEWTVPAIGFKLQRAESLTNPEWADVAATPRQVGDRVRAAITATGNQGYYRLVKP